MNNGVYVKKGLSAAIAGKIYDLNFVIQVTQKVTLRFYSQTFHLGDCELINRKKERLVTHSYYAEFQLDVGSSWTV